MQMTGLAHISYELLELLVIKGVSVGGIGCLHAGHARDIPVRSSSVPDR
jgi:hypothetical protein